MDNIKPRKRNPESVKELLDRYEAGERNFRGMKIVSANLQSAMLEGADLSNVVLGYARLTGAKLRGANLHCANLLRADLAGTDLRGARLTQAHLLGADLSISDLTEADLSGADLARANLLGAILKDTNCASVRLDYTVLMDINIGCLITASPPPRHTGSSGVDHRTIIKSINCPRLADFLVHAGMPASYVTYMIDCARSLSPEGNFRMLQSTFISYGHPDEKFAQRLNDALAQNGVSTFFFPSNATFGKKLHRVMRDGINQYDRVILICSKNSLSRPGVLNEINEALQREARDGGTEYLIPITLDDYVFSGWTPDAPGLAQAIRDRVVADFQGADTDQSKFDSQLLRLITALK